MKEYDKRVYVGIPSIRLPHDFVISFVKLWGECSKDKRFIGFNIQFGKPVGWSQNTLAMEAVQNNATHLLLLEDDITDVSIDDVIKLLDADVPVISGQAISKDDLPICWRKRIKGNTVGQTIRDGHLEPLYFFHNEIEPVDFVGLGLSLIECKVFKSFKREDTWFPYESFRHLKGNHVEATDIGFMGLCEKYGIDRYVHGGVRLTHDGVKRLNKGANDA